MSQLYEDLAATAHELLSEFGESASLVHAAGNYNPNTGGGAAEGVTDSVKVVTLNYSAFEVNGTSILATDRKVLMSPVGITQEIKPSARLKVGSKTYKVMNCVATSPGGVAVVYEVQARA